MKRLFAIGLSVFILVSFSADTSGSGGWCAMPESPGIGFVYGPSGCVGGQRKYFAALGEAQRYLSTVNQVWCVTDYWMKKTSRRACKQWEGKGFDNESEAHADAEHKRQKKALAAERQPAYRYCFDSDSRSYYFRVNQGCGNDDKEITKQEYSKKQLVNTPVIKIALLTIRSNVKDDKVYIDNKFKGSSRLDIDLPQGRHTIRIEKNGYKTYEESINLTDNFIIRGHLIKIVEQPVQTVVVDNTAEIEFWKSVKDSADPDMYREYLRQFPQGVYAGLAKLKIKKLGGETTSVAQSSIPNLDYGDYYALVIGNNRHDHLGDLRTAVNDARSVANLLELDYGFNVTKLENANRDQIIKSISGLRSKVSSQDNVLIYYAGHGYLDEAADEGFWLPTDASPDDPSNWITTDRIVGQVRAMKAKHVMVVADSYFSGTITRGIKIKIKQPTREWLETIVKEKARTALTSGGLEPVMDSGGGNSSVFANAFLSILRGNDGVLDASQLFTQLRPKVMVNSDQTPEYGDIHRAGHDGGDFLFVKTAKLNLEPAKDSSIETPEAVPNNATEVTFWQSIKDSDDEIMFQAYLDEYPNGKFAPLAKIKIKKFKSTSSSSTASSLDNKNVFCVFQKPIGGDCLGYLVKWQCDLRKGTSFTDHVAASNAAKIQCSKSGSTSAESSSSSTGGDDK